MLKFKYIFSTWQFGLWSDKVLSFIITKKNYVKLLFIFCANRMLYNNLGKCCVFWFIGSILFRASFNITIFLLFLTITYYLSIINTQLILVLPSLFLNSCHFSEWDFSFYCSPCNYSGNFLKAILLVSPVLLCYIYLIMNVIFVINKMWLIS